MGGAYSTYRVEERCIERLGGKTRRKGRSRRRWEDNNGIDVQEVECRDKDWIELAQDRDRWRAFVKVVISHQVP
jgi:hypothetical protein